MADVMRPLEDWPPAHRRGIRGVFTDIDDTLTTHGRITPDAMDALAGLKTAGYHVVAITGRPIGWCAKFLDGSAGPPWPVDAIVAENGTVAWLRSEAGFDSPSEIGLQRPPALRETLSKIYYDGQDVRAERWTRMLQVAERVLREVPGAVRTADCAGRETDLAFDVAEHTRLDAATVARIVTLLQAEGMHTTVSSIHIHGCFGHSTKWTGAQWIFKTLFGRELADELDHWVFVGDSGNDESMFEHFIHSVGVANIARVAASLTHLPRYVATRGHGAGFAQVADCLLLS